MADTRYPYTYAADLIKSGAGYNADGIKLSRAEAAQIISEVAEALGMNRDEMSRKLADYYQKDAEARAERSVQKFIEARANAGVPW